MPERYGELGANRLAESTAAALGVSPFRAFSAPVRVTCAVADSPIDVAHDLQAIPDGMLVLWADTVVHATPGQAWTHEIAYVQSPTAGATAIIVFVLLTEAVD